MSLYQPEMLCNNVFYLYNDHHLLFNRIENACTWSSSSLLFEICDEQNDKEKNSRDDFVMTDNIMEYEYLSIEWHLKLWKIVNKMMASKSWMCVRVCISKCIRSIKLPQWNDSNDGRWKKRKISNSFANILQATFHS